MKRTVLTAIAILMTIATAASALPYPSNPPSGLMLGVRVFENWRGLRVMDTIPGYAADGVLLPNDVITRMADSDRIYDVRSLMQFEMAKDRVGPHAPAAIEVNRPGWGTVYFFVELTPLGGAPAARAYTGTLAPQLKTTIRKATPQEAIRMFKRGNQGPQIGAPNVKPKPFPNPRPTVKPLPSSNNPADLFSRR